MGCSIFGVMALTVEIGSANQIQIMNQRILASKSDFGCMNSEINPIASAQMAQPKSGQI